MRYLILALLLLASCQSTYRSPDVGHEPPAEEDAGPCPEGTELREWPMRAPTCEVVGVEAFR